MKKLNDNWITEKHIDFEYKKYVLLAYLQQVSEHFTETKLYPSLSELVQHYRNVIQLRDNKKNIYERFPQSLSRADLENLKLIYERMLNDDEIMHEIETIIDYSIPQFEKYLSEGKKMYEYIESNLNIFPVGIMPLHASEGYIMLKDGSANAARVYEYQVTIFENPDERFRGISVQYMNTYEMGLLGSYESIKHDLIRYNRRLPNPAAYVIETELVLPWDETFLPLAKRCIVKYIAKKNVN